MFKKEKNKTEKKEKKSLKEFFTKERISALLFMGGLLLNILGGIFLIKPQYHKLTDLKEELVIIEEDIIIKENQVARLESIVNERVLGERDNKDIHRIPDNYYASQLVQWIAQVADENDQIQPLSLTIAPLEQSEEFPILQSQIIELGLVMPQYLIGKFSQIVEQEKDQIYTILSIQADQNKAINEEEILTSSMEVYFTLETYYASGNGTPIEIEGDENEGEKEVFNPFGNV